MHILPHDISMKNLLKIVGMMPQAIEFFPPTLLVLAQFSKSKKKIMAHFKSNVDF